MGNDFLNDLSDKLEKGEFNSDVANKINKISELAEEKASGNTEKELKEKIDERINERIESSGGVETIDPDKISEINSEYDEKMKKRSIEEEILAYTATLINNDELVQKNILDVKSLIGEFKGKYEADNETCVETFKLIKELEEKYNI